MTCQFLSAFWKQHQIFFLLPNLTHYATKHSYILELKVLPKKDYEAKPEDGKLSKAEVQWQEAEEQIKRYAVARLSCE